MNTYQLNARNQLASISGAISASFQYDAFGRRVSKTINGQTTGYLYDGSNAVQEIAGGSPLANMLMGRVDEVFSRTDVTGTQSRLADGLGSTLALADSAGVAHTQYTYDAFGNTTASGAAGSNTSQYTGRENDGTGLYYNRARYYSPSLQRFISEDPIGFGGGDVNLYAYVQNSPANFTDPSGKVIFGQTLNVSAAAGAGALSVGGTGSVLSGYSISGRHGLTHGTAVSGGAFAFSSSDNYSFGRGIALGASAGAGGGYFFSNANSFKDLQGDFKTIIISLPLVSVEIDFSGTIFVASLTAGVGKGLSIMGLHTYTPACSIVERKIPTDLGLDAARDFNDLYAQPTQFPYN